VLEPGGEPEEVRRETLAIIRKESARLFRLLTNLLDFARPREPERRAVDVRQVFDSVLQLVRHSGGKRIEFRAETPGNLPRLMCDEEQLAQVVLNLAMNAVQAMPEGGEVRLTATQQNGGILIQVRDQGCGIPDEHLDKVFDPFFTTKDGGTGLGLSVVHQIVSQHGGSVKATRNPDRGMTFSLFFPQAGGTSHGG
jgi:two-component system, NtrC family, sensor histidine kinase HydH